MNKVRVWLFAGLVVATAGLMLLSWFMPWWSASVAALGIQNAVIIHPYGLEQHLGEVASFIGGAEMPAWFAPLMWIYLGLCVVALLYTSWIGEKEGKWGKLKFKWAKLLLGGVGLSYILVAVLAVTVAAIRTGDYFNMSLLGYTYLGDAPSGDEVIAFTSLQFGYYMAYGVGLVCIALALLRDKIIGKPKLNT